MKRNIFLTLTLSCCLLIACTTDANMPESPKNYVSFFPSEAPARASDTKFENGDQIGVYAMKDNGNVTAGQIGYTNYANNMPYQYIENSKFTPMGNGIELPSDGSKLYYYAIYPYSTLSSSNFTFEVWTDQTAYNHYTTSDLMIAYTTSSSDKENINLSFSHCLSKVIISPKNFNAVYSFTLKDMYYKADVNLNYKTFTNTGNKATIKMCSNGTNSFKAIVPPQTITDGMMFGYMECNEGNYNITASGNIELQAGKQTEIIVYANESRGQKHFFAIQKP